MDRKKRNPGKHTHIPDEYNAKFDEGLYRKVSTCIICGCQLRCIDDQWYTPKNKPKRLRRKN